MTDNDWASGTSWAPDGAFTRKNLQGGFAGFTPQGQQAGNMIGKGIAAFGQSLMQQGPQQGQMQNPLGAFARGLQQGQQQMPQGQPMMPAQPQAQGQSQQPNMQAMAQNPLGTWFKALFGNRGQP